MRYIQRNSANLFFASFISPNQLNDVRNLVLQVKSWYMRKFALIICPISSISKSKARQKQNKTKNKQTRSFPHFYKFKVLLLDCLKIKYDIHGSRNRIVNPVFTLLKPSRGTTTSTRFNLQFSRILSKNRHPGILHCPFFHQKKG